jgi:hypothetical protein
MSGRKSVRGTWASRCLSPCVEDLDRRELMTAGGLPNSLGPYLNPSQFGPRISQPAKVVNPHTSIQQLLSSVLGPGIDKLQAQSKSIGDSPRAVLKQTVLEQRYVHSILSDGDVYRLFGSPAFNSLIGSQQVSGMTSISSQSSPATNTASTTPTTSTSSSTATPSAPSGTASTAAPDPLVAFSIPQQASIQSIGTSTSVVQVNPVNGIAGFLATVPISNIHILSQGPPVVGSVLIPLSLLPTGFPVPTATVISIGTFSSTYASTTPLLQQMFNAGVRGVSPNAPNAVPGLRLAPFLLHNNPFPTQVARKDFEKTLRLAVQRNVFTLNGIQTAAVSAGISQFAAQVRAMGTNGEFTPAVPKPPPSLPSRSLSGTLEVSVGAVRRLLDVDPSISGLPLPVLGNFPGRLDVGFIFDRSGNYGIILTLRGPLLNANPVPTPVDVASGDVRVEVSNATNIGALTGRRLVEGVEVGSGVSADLGISQYDSGVSTFSASAGDGFGLEYGTGVGYSTVIPLGNVHALIPSFPPL